ncbi:MAG: hypothetical protein ACI4F9_07325 [Lachnospiraceae bacterium]
MQKGKKGYLNKYKKNQLLKTGIAFAIILLIVILALLIEHTTKTVMIVAAVVGALPAAKILVGFIVVAPFSSYDGERVTGELAANGREFFDLCISTEEKIIFVPYLYMTEDKMFALVNVKKGLDKNKFKRYLQNWMKGEDLYFKVSLFEDEKSMIREVNVELTRKMQEDEKKNKNDLDKARDRLLILVP